MPNVAFYMSTSLGAGSHALQQEQSISKESEPVRAWNEK